MPGTASRPTLTGGQLGHCTQRQLLQVLQVKLTRVTASACDPLLLQDAAVC